MNSELEHNYPDDGYDKFVVWVNSVLPSDLTLRDAFYAGMLTAINCTETEELKNIKNYVMEYLDRKNEIQF